MSQPSKQRRRVVSWTSYLGHLSKKAILFLLGIVLFLLGLVSVIVGCLLAFCIFALGILVNNAWSIPFSLLGAFLVGSLSLLVVRFSVRMMDKADGLEPVVPLTRHAAAQLSLEESLVRAGSEPSVPPEAILLRAATSSEETPAEQLLRAVRQESIRDTGSISYEK